MANVGEDPRGLCEYCGATTQQLWLVSHHQTATHWRCTKCMRSLARECPIVVSGCTTKHTGSRRVASQLKTRRIARLVRQEFDKPERTEGEKP